MTNTPTIQTERLILRKFKEEDAEAFWEIMLPTFIMLVTNWVHIKWHAEYDFWNDLEALQSEEIYHHGSCGIKIHC